MFALCVLSLAVLLFIYTLFNSCLLLLVTGRIMQSLLLCLSTERHLTCQSPLPLQLHEKYPLFHIMNSHFNFDFKFQSLNVWGLNKSIKRRSIFRWLQDQNYHFTFLQETYSSIERAHIWEAEWGGKSFFSHGTS